MKFNPKLWFCLASIFSLALFSCRKKQAAVSVRVTVSDANTAKVWRQNADTSGRLWVLGVRSGSGVLRNWQQEKSGNGRNIGSEAVINASVKWGLVIEDAISSEDSNANDAQITSVKVSYVNKKGKSIEDNIGAQEIGAEFNKDYQVPSGGIITVTAKASQTGETKYLAEQVLKIVNTGYAANGTSSGNLDAVRDGTRKVQNILNANAGKRTANAKVRLIVEILRNGVVIGGKEIQSQAQVENTVVALVVDSKK